MAKAISKNTLQKVVAKKVNKPVFRADAKQTTTLVKVARQSAANAIRTTKALNLPITYMQNGVVIKEQANGKKEVIGGEKATTQKKKATVTLKKGMVLYAKK